MDDTVERGSTLGSRKLYLELLRVVFSSHTDGIDSTKFIKELFEFLLQSAMFFPKSFLDVQWRSDGKICTRSRVERTAYMLLSHCPFGSLTSVLRRTFTPASSTSSSRLVRSALTSQSCPNCWNSRMRLKDATVWIGTQCSAFAPRRHLQLLGPTTGEAAGADLSDGRYSSPK